MKINLPVKSKVFYDCIKLKIILHFHNFNSQVFFFILFVFKVKGSEMELLLERIPSAIIRIVGIKSNLLTICKSISI
jgi:hypothetical protein